MQKKITNPFVLLFSISIYSQKKKIYYTEDCSTELRTTVIYEERVEMVLKEKPIILMAPIRKQ
jgi:hypothetical protein